MHVKMLSLSTYTLKLRLPSYCFSVRWHLVRGIDKLPHHSQIGFLPLDQIDNTDLS